MSQVTVQQQKASCECYTMTTVVLCTLKASLNDVHRLNSTQKKEREKLEHFYYETFLKLHK